MGNEEHLGQGTVKEAMNSNAVKQYKNLRTATDEDSKTEHREELQIQQIEE